MFHLVHVGDDGVRTTREVADLSALDEHGPGWTWIDVLGPTEAERHQIAARFDLHRVSLDDLFEAQSPKLDLLDTYWVLVAHGLAVDDSTIRTAEVDIVVGQDWVVTAHSEPEVSIEDVARLVLQPTFAVDDPQHLAIRIVEFMAERYLPILDELDAQVLDLEDLAVEGDPRVLPDIHALRRDIAVLRRMLGPQRRVLDSLHRADSGITERARRDLADALDHHDRLVDSIDAAHQMVSNVLDTYRGAAAERMNEVMKVLTVISSIFLPLTLIAGIYGMNFDHMPELERRWAYPVTLAAMATLGIGMWVYFVRRGVIGGPKVRDLAVPAKAAGRVGRGLASVALLPIKATSRATSQLLNGSADDG